MIYPEIQAFCREISRGRRKNDCLLKIEDQEFSNFASIFS
jgi:hypothetical protein